MDKDLKNLMQQLYLSNNSEGNYKLRIEIHKIQALRDIADAIKYHART